MIFSNKVFFHAVLAAAAAYRSRLLQSQVPADPFQSPGDESEILATFPLRDAALSAVLYLIAKEVLNPGREQIIQ